jgi:hypothetical protein
MSQILLNILFGLLLGTGGMLLKVPFKSKTSVKLSSYMLFFIGGFIVGFAMMPIAMISKAFVLSLVIDNPMIFTTKAFKVIVGVGTAGAFLAGFKIGKWEI